MLHFLSIDIIYNHSHVVIQYLPRIAALTLRMTCSFHYTVAVREISLQCTRYPLLVMLKTSCLCRSSDLVRYCTCFRSIIPLVRDLNLFRELLGLLLCLRAKLLGLVDDGVGAFLGLLCGLAELALDGGNAILCLELKSLLTATHAAEQLAFQSRRTRAEVQAYKDILGVYVLPVLDVTVTLGSLCAEVDHVASEEEVVSGLHGHGVAHEGSAVTDKSCGHGTRDTVVETFISFAIQYGFFVRNPTHAQPSEVVKHTSRGLSGCP
jgi:hypothetical protein